VAFLNNAVKGGKGRKKGRSHTSLALQFAVRRKGEGEGGKDIILCHLTCFPILTLIKEGNRRKGRGEEKKKGGFPSISHPE